MYSLGSKRWFQCGVKRGAVHFAKGMGGGVGLRLTEHLLCARFWSGSLCSWVPLCWCPKNAAQDRLASQVKQQCGRNQNSYPGRSGLRMGAFPSYVSAYC